MKNTTIEYENLAKVNAKFKTQLTKSFANTLKKGSFILGNEVETFENNFAQYNNSLYCTGVASGLDAITLSIAACDFPKGSEIIVPSNTYIATILSILHNGMVPILVEPDIQTYNINPLKIEEKITINTKAIIAVHLYGNPCSMDFINALCNKYDLILIEDCAQAHGAKYNGRKVGTFGDFGAFSFYPTKNLGALGDAGAILTKNGSYKEKIRMLRNYGSNTKYHNELVGHNSRLDEIQAAFLSIKLKHLDKINSHKRKLAKLYLQNLDKEKFVLPFTYKPDYSVYHIFNIRHPQRLLLKDYLLKKGIKTEIHYPIPPHKQNALKKYFFRQEYQVSENIHRTTLSLPISYIHTEDDIYRVIETMNKF